jgi:hypothetical protein
MTSLSVGGSTANATLTTDSFADEGFGQGDRAVYFG